jgi:serine protease
MRAKPFFKIAICAGVLAGLSGYVHASNPPDVDAKISAFQATLAGTDTDFQRFIVFYDESTKSSTLDSVTSSLDDVSKFANVSLNPVRQLATGGWLIESSDVIGQAQASDVMRELALRNDVVSAQPDYVYDLASADPSFGAQWSMTAVTEPGYDCIPNATCRQAGANVVAAWNYSVGDGIVIAVLDTGYTDHPDLLPNLATPNYTTHRVGYDFVSNSPHPYDQNDPYIGDPIGPDSNAHDPGDWATPNPSDWHGTHVMGIAAAAYNNNLYGAGVAPHAKILPVRVMGAGGKGNDSDITEGIIWAAGGLVPNTPYNSTPARVLNLSIGKATPCSLDGNMQAAIDNARANGSVVVVAAGNDHVNVSGFSPASCNHVITVAATGYTGAIGSLQGGVPYSNFGAGVSLAAPGGGWIRVLETGSMYLPIYSDVNNGVTTPGSPGWGGKVGTSMAAPMVAGLAALITSMKPWLTPDQVKTYIMAHTHPWGTGGVPPATDALGSGLMDAGATVAAVAGIAAPPIATFNAAPNPVVIPAGQPSATYQMTWNVPGYPTVDSYANINGGPVEFTGILGSSGTLTETATYGQTITWYLYPHGHTPTGTPIKTLTVTNHH